MTDPLVRFAHLVGDFGNPFYAEERHRDVWNEASAFGLQLGVWTALVGATVAVWVVGAPAVPPVQVVLALAGAVCLLTVAYATRLGVVPPAPRRLLRLRLLPVVLLLAALGAGFARAGAGTPSFLLGVGTGLLVVVGAAALAARRGRDRAPEA